MTGQHLPNFRERGHLPNILDSGASPRVGTG
jgi:hypothetical protein